MSIIDRAREHATALYFTGRPNPTIGALRVAAFTHGVEYALDQLQDPDQATVDAVAQAILGAWQARGDALPDAVLRWEFKADARAAITALTNHLNGDPS